MYWKFNSAKDSKYVPCEVGTETMRKALSEVMRKDPPQGQILSVEFVGKIPYSEVV